MTKQKVIFGALKLIEKLADEHGLEVTDHGTGHAFERTFWNGVLKDDSGIPNVVATNDKFSIELRSFWGAPEVDVRRNVEGGEELLIFNFNDSMKIDDKYEHTGDFEVQQVRVEARHDYKACIEEVYRMIDFVVEAVSQMPEDE